MAQSGKQPPERRQPRATARADKSAGGRPEFKGFVNFTPPEALSERLDGFIEAGKFWPTLAELVDKGYQFSVRLDAANDCYLCSVSCNDPDCRDAGYVYTERSGSVDRVLAKAVFLVNTILADHMSDYVTGGRIRYW